VTEFAKHEEGNNWSLMSQSVDTKWRNGCLEATVQISDKKTA
jgi:hypothetical protein